MTQSILRQSQVRPMRLCALEYRAEEIEGIRQDSPAAIVVAVLDEADVLSIFFDRDWRRHVKDRDKSYFESLLKDFAVRKKSGPRELFEQFCSLNVGPLATIEDLPSAPNSEMLVDILKGLRELENEE